MSTRTAAWVAVPFGSLKVPFSVRLGEEHS
jgi:hypothetical protein